METEITCKHCGSYLTVMNGLCDKCRSAHFRLENLHLLGDIWAAHIIKEACLRRLATNKACEDQRRECEAQARLRFEQFRKKING